MKSVRLLDIVPTLAFGEGTSQKDLPASFFEATTSIGLGNALENTSNLMDMLIRTLEVPGIELQFSDLQDMAVRLLNLCAGLKYYGRLRTPSDRGRAEAQCMRYLQGNEAAKKFFEEWK